MSVFSEGCDVARGNGQQRGLEYGAKKGKTNRENSKQNQECHAGPAQVNKDEWYRFDMAM
ncbi:hypothetical protein GCM10007071_17020 [Marinobacter zhanjiangensis]|uniref:Uncharacterized protein n=1 Tax=Marinobacter zhanjiangensis TaxID=578215 RepID=A0ABQ3B1H5_9GAMM|nr:hypothetical protein GCM10007071_17020 [Marinobacter zhanjiangensis]